MLHKSVANNSVKENGTDATYITQEINSNQFDLGMVNVTGTGSFEVVNLTGNRTTAITQTLVDGPNTVDLSELDTDSIQLRVKLDSDAAINDLEVYGTAYTNDVGGGIIGPTGDFLADVPVVGDFLNGVATGLRNAVNNVLSLPQQIFEDITDSLQNAIEVTPLG